MCLLHTAWYTSRISREANIAEIEQGLHRRRVIRWTMAGVALLLLGAVALDHINHTGNDWRRYDRRSVSVQSIQQPDLLQIDGELIQLLGVDASKDGLHGHDQSLEYTKARIKGSVTLKLEPTQTRDSAGYLLAYVYLADNDCLNLAVIRDGKAYADRRIKHTFAGQFEQAEADARKKSRGIWKDLTEDQMPQWRREWLQQMRQERSTTRPAR